MGLLAGERSDSVSVFVISIDDGQVLWVGKDRLGNTAAIAPGKHKVLIACAFTTSSGKQSRAGELLIEVEPGKTYDVSGELSADGLQFSYPPSARRAAASVSTLPTSRIGPVTRWA